MQSLPFLRLWFLLLPTGLPPPSPPPASTDPPVQSFRDGSIAAVRSPEREVTPTRRHNGECGRRLTHGQTERSDGPMMYLQTVAEEVGHSGIKEAGRREDRKTGRGEQLGTFLR